MTTKSVNGFAANAPHEKMARGLGWFSLGLGLAQLLAPRKLGRAIGVGDHPLLMRLLGLREVANGIGILTRSNPAAAVKARVAGDMMDLTLLGAALTTGGGRPGRILLATAATAGVAALDVKCARQLAENPETNIRALHVCRTIIIDRPTTELYEFWRNFENLPRFMNHLQAVSILDKKHSHWVAKGPAGTNAEWDAEIVNEHPGQMIAWRSLPGAPVMTAGTVRFESATGGRGTLVRVEMQVDPPAGVLGATVARLFGESPAKQVHVDLHRFKQLMETGEIARTEGQPAGRSRSTSRMYDDFVRA